MDKNNLTPEEGFSIINKAITSLKMNYKENAKVFLLWGWAMTLASFSNYIILKILQSNGASSHMGFYSLANWVIFIFAAFIILYIWERKTVKTKKVYSHLENYIRKLWIGAGLGFFVGTFICFKLGINPPVIMLLVAGIATTATGLIIKFKPVVIGGIAFFAFSIACSFVYNENIALLTGLAIICGYIIPGYFLKTAKE